MDLGDDSHSPWGDEPGSLTSTGTPKNGDAQKDDQDTKSAAPADEKSTPTSSTPVKSPGGRGPRKIKRHGAQPTKIEAVDDALGPLGPLGDSFKPQEESDDPPALPQKEPTPAKNSRPATAVSQPYIHSAENEDDSLPSRPRVPPPVQPPASPAPRRQSQPSVSVEQAAKPTFHITVGDPHTVGDLTSSHTVYQVRTKTTSKAYRNQEFEVSRRYRDFRWLYNQLHSNNPGIVVPPPPDKQAVGRFESDFVESRRSALERMLNKTAAHPILQHDGDLKLFLESESFTVDMKQRERKDPDMPESRGMFSGLNLSVGSGTKFVEHDDWFLDRRIYLDTLESQLKALLKATDIAVTQRKALAEACGDLSASLNVLSEVELSPSVTGPLASLSDLHMRIRELYDRQAQQDVLTLGNIIDEYIRLIGSIKKAFEQRQRSWQGWHNAESDLQKRKSALDKVMRQGRSQQDRLSQLQADVGDAERRAHQARLQFDDLGKGMRAELERFEKEKVEDFRMGVETYLESAVEAQKELIELWETYLMHMDAEEDGSSLPAAGIRVAPTPNSSQTAALSEGARASIDEPETPGDDVEGSRDPNATIISSVEQEA